MLGIEIVDSGRAGTPAKVIERRVALAQGDDMLFRNLRQKLTKTPHTALVNRIGRVAAVRPEGGDQAGIIGQPGKNKLKQVSALGAAKVLAGGTGSCAAGDTAELRARGGLICFHVASSLARLQSYGR